MRRGLAGLVVLVLGGLGSSGQALAAPRLVGQWHMDEISGNTMVDSSGQGNNGTGPGNSGKAKNVLVGQPGLVGTAYYFNGKNSIVAIPSSPSLNPGSSPFTATVNLKFNSRPSSDTWDPIRKGYSSTSGGDFKLEILPSATARCSFKTSKGSAKVSGGSNLADDNWHKVSCSRTSSGVRLEVDGKSYSKSASLGSISNDAPLNIGAKTAGQDHFKGLIDEVRLTIG